MKGVRMLPACVALLLAQPGMASASDCSRTSVGLTPLIDMGSQTYEGVPGGLYPGGENSMPASHQAAGLQLARSVEPLDSAGSPDPGGRYVLLSIGMSNTTQEFQSFVAASNSDADRDPALVVVDGAQSGQVAHIIADPASNYWSVIDDRLAAGGVSPQQVVAAWIKAANPADTSTSQYRSRLQDDLEEIARVLKDKFPNLKLGYYTSRIYAGYATTDLNPEPYAYESGFVVRFAIESQLNGNPSMNFDPDGGTVNTPWVAWGPYLWADGLTPRSDGVRWECADFASDGTHPSASGEDKVAGMLMDFVKSDPTAREWYLANPGSADTVPPAPPENLMVEP